MRKTMKELAAIYADNQHERGTGGDMYNAFLAGHSECKEEIVTELERRIKEKEAIEYFESDDHENFVMAERGTLRNILTWIKEK